jgi:hypothetical protein
VTRSPSVSESWMGRCRWPRRRVTRSAPADVGSPPAADGCHTVVTSLHARSRKARVAITVAREPAPRSAAAVITSGATSSGAPVRSRPSTPVSRVRQFADRPVSTLAAPAASSAVASTSASAATADRARAAPPRRRWRLRPAPVPSASTRAGSDGRHTAPTTPTGRGADQPTYGPVTGCTAPSTPAILSVQPAYQTQRSTAASTSSAAASTAIPSAAARSAASRSRRSSSSSATPCRTRPRSSAVVAAPARQGRLRGRDRLGHLARAGDRPRTRAARRGVADGLVACPATGLRRACGRSATRPRAERTPARPGLPGKPVQGRECRMNVAFRTNPERGTIGRRAYRDHGRELPGRDCCGHSDVASACSVDGRSSTPARPTPTRSSGRSRRGRPGARRRAGRPAGRSSRRPGRPLSSTCRGAASEPTGAPAPTVSGRAQAACPSTRTCSPRPPRHPHRAALRLTMADSTPVCAAVRPPRRVVGPGPD